MSETGGSGTFKILAPLAGSETTELPLIFVATILANITLPHARLYGLNVN